MRGVEAGWAAPLHWSQHLSARSGLLCLPRATGFLLRGIPGSPPRHSISAVLKLQSSSLKGKRKMLGWLPLPGMITNLPSDLEPLPSLLGSLCFGDPARHGSFLHFLTYCLTHEHAQACQEARPRRGSWLCFPGIAGQAPA